MNLDDAIAKHVEWKVKLRSAMIKKEKLDPDAIRRDNACELGKWLHGPGQTQHGRHGSFPELVQKHAEFHKQAALVATEINAGHNDKATQMLDAGSSYSSASSAVGASIARLKKEIGA